MLPHRAFEQLPAAHSTTAMAGGIRAFVKKNKAIPAFYEVIAADPFGHGMMVKALVTAIHEGDLTHEIFSHPDCMNYVLYLIECEPTRVPFWSCVSAYQYLLALAQFTAKQDLKLEDNSLKMIRACIPVSLIDVNRQCLTTEGIIYFNHVKFALKTQHIEFDEHTFVTYLLARPKIDHMIIRISNVYSTHKENSTDELMTILKVNVPFFKDVDTDIFNLPSAAIMNYFMSLASKRPMQMRPILGRISLETLANLHAQRMHPVAWYSANVQKTIMSVHDYPCGPFPAMAHDVGHCWWSCLLAPEEVDIIEDIMLPKLAELNLQLNHFVATALIKTLCTHLTDYDLTPMNSYSTPRNRFVNYMLKAIRRMGEKSLELRSDTHYLADILKCLNNLAAQHIAKVTTHNAWGQLHSRLNQNYRVLINSPTVTPPTAINLSDAESKDTVVAEPLHKKAKPGQ